MAGAAEQPLSMQVDKRGRVTDKKAMSETPVPAQPAPAAPLQQSAPKNEIGPTKISVSRGLADWLRSNRMSFAFTSYQTGQLFLVGVLPNGTVSFNQQNFTRAMGVSYQPGRLYLGSLHQVWRLENMLRPGEVANQQFDMALVPRNAQTTGDVDVHEVGTDKADASSS
jgi:Domain of unknown function (DUF4915)